MNGRVMIWIAIIIRTRTCTQIDVILMIAGLVHRESLAVTTNPVRVLVASYPLTGFPENNENPN